MEEKEKKGKEVEEKEARGRKTRRGGKEAKLFVVAMMILPFMAVMRVDFMREAIF